MTYARIRKMFASDRETYRRTLIEKIRMYEHSLLMKEYVPRYRKELRKVEKIIAECSREHKAHLGDLIAQDSALLKRIESGQSRANKEVVLKSIAGWAERLIELQA